MKNCHLTKTSAVALAALIGSSAFAATIPDGMQWGVTFGFYATNGYFGSVEAKAEIDAITRAGVTWETVSTDRPWDLWQVLTAGSAL